MAKKAEKQQPWADRIVGSASVDPKTLTEHPLNWRIHTQEQREALEAVLGRVGFVQDCIVNKRTGHLLDGHLRRDVAIKNGQQLIPVKYVDLSVDEEHEVLAIFDRLTVLARTDIEKTVALFEKLPESLGNEALDRIISRAADAAREALASTAGHTTQAEPVIDEHALIEIRCKRSTMQTILPTLEEWSRIDGVSVDVS